LAYVLSLSAISRTLRLKIAVRPTIWCGRVQRHNLAKALGDHYSWRERGAPGRRNGVDPTTESKRERALRPHPLVEA
jgi:hypothetical protein